MTKTATATLPRAHETGTPERMARATGRIDGRQRDFKTARDGDRIVPVFERMARTGQISTEERVAGERYAAHWFGACRSPGLVGAYGEQRWSSTSASAADLTREERPTHCALELVKARRAIQDRRLVEVLESVVEADATLESIGRGYLGSKSPPQAMAAGAVLIKLALQRLCEHYRG